jgi:hypothetical protein
MTLVMLAAGALVPAMQGAAASPTSEGQPVAATTGLEQRTAALEHRMANLQRIIAVPLDDDAAVERAVAQVKRQQAAAAGHVVVSLLMTLRSQMELYQIMHAGHYPDLLAGWDQMTGHTDQSGHVVSDPKAKGPYLNEPLVNPLTESSKVVTVDKVGPDAGWVFDPTTGTLRAVASKVQAATYGLKSSDVKVY